jgi:hypothetical protein
VAYSPSHQSNRAYSLLWNDLKIEIHTTYFLLNALRSNTKQHRYGVQTFLCKKKLSEHVLQKKITIRKLNQLLYFYFNEELFHIMEYDYHKGKGNYFANLSTLDMIKTTFFSGELVDFRVEVAYLK